jgi:phage terminase large subunit-like protein
MSNLTATQYIDDVLSGRQVVCKWVRLAVARHVNDLETGHERGLRFDETEAKKAIAFFALLKHSKGEWARKTIVLEPWQQFHLWVLFGWRRADGTRRFRTSYLEVARKNGKSTMAAGVGLYMLVADGEPGAEVYTGATKRDQARIIHAEAVRMVKQSPALRNSLTLYKDNIHDTKAFSKFEPLGKDSKTMDGLNVHGGIIDELHAHPDGDLWDVLETATGSRRQPLMYAITTAGNNPTTASVCFQFHDYTEKALSGVVEDDAFFGTIYSLDIDPETRKTEDWEDEAVWIKANPNLDVSKKRADMQDQARRVKEMPARLNSFLQKHLNLWVSQAIKWLNMDYWNACNQPLPNLSGRQCYSGLDLSSTIDITAEVKVFPPLDDDEPYWILPTFWVPEDRIWERSKRDRVPYEAWLRQGHILATPGNAVDYDFIVANIEADSKIYDIKEIAFDRWGAFQLSQSLSNEGFTMVPFGQGYASMSAPAKELEAKIMKANIAHGGHPVLRWMADNVVTIKDPAGNIKPDKSKSREKIDGIVGTIMALDRAIRNEGTQRGSVYEERGLTII